MGSNEVWLQTIIEAALNGQPLTLNVNLGPVTDAINTMNSNLHDAIGVSNADLTGVISALATTNTDLLNQIASLATVKTAIDAVTAAVNAKASTAIFSYTKSTKFNIAALVAATSAVLIPANPNRKGFTVYNNSTNSLYVCIENPAVAANLIDFCGSNAGPTSLVKWMGPGVPTGVITVIRNAGTGGVTAWEFE